VGVWLLLFQDNVVVSKCEKPNTQYRSVISQNNRYLNQRNNQSVNHKHSYRQASQVQTLLKINISNVITRHHILVEQEKLSKHTR